jgi:hypothetical protein
MSKYKIAVGMITGDYKAHLGTLASFIELVNQDMSDFRFTPVFESSIYVDRNRTMVAASFLEDTDSDYLLFLDSDNGITKEGLLYFMEDFEDPGVNIVTGKYHYKGDREGLFVCGYQPPEATLYNYQSFPDGAFTKDVVNITQETGTAVVGCGCLMIRRRVLDEVPYPWFDTPWVEGPGSEGGTGHLWVGEDVYFSFHVQKHGFDIHLDQRIQSPHYQGSKCYPPEWDQTNID